MRKFGLLAKLFRNFYRCTVESIPTNIITVCFGNCTVQERKALVIKTAQHYICGAALLSLQDIYNTKWAHKITKDTTHPQHTLFTLLPSSRTCRVLSSSKLRISLPYAKYVSIVYMTLNTVNLDNLLTCLISFNFKYRQLTPSRCKSKESLSVCVPKISLRIRIRLT